jgi:hypothetical protein
MVTGCRSPARMISAISSSLKRRCLPMNVHGISRADALVLSHDSRTLRILAASATVCSSPVISHPALTYRRNSSLAP